MDATPRQSWDTGQMLLDWRLRLLLTWTRMSSRSIRQQSRPQNSGQVISGFRRPTQSCSLDVSHLRPILVSSHSSCLWEMWTPMKFSSESRLVTSAASSVTTVSTMATWSSPTSECPAKPYFPALWISRRRVTSRWKRTHASFTRSWFRQELLSSPVLRLSYTMDQKSQPGMLSAGDSLQQSRALIKSASFWTTSCIWIPLLQT